MRNYKGKKAEMYKFLKEKVQARERKNKDLACMKLLRSKTKYAPIFEALKGIDGALVLLAELGADFSTYDRSWRDILESNTELRGTDYREKKKLEKKALRDMGRLSAYSPYHN